MSRRGPHLDTERVTQTKHAHKIKKVKQTTKTKALNMS